MRVVAVIARLLARYNNAKVDVAECAAWLHDLVRLKEQWAYVPPTIPTPLPHAEINYLLLRDQWPAVALAIRTHSLMTIFDQEPFETVEAKIVYYADKRVNHTTIVSLEDRLKLGWERWKVHAENDRTAELLPKLLALERELFTNIPFSPNDIETAITPSKTNKHAFT